jgi:hypothetical protein
VAAGGVLAELLGRSSTAIAIAGVAGLIFAVNAAAAWARVDPRRVAAALNADN